MNRRSAAARFLASLVLLAAVPVGAQDKVPSPADVLGWEMGERFTDVDEVNRYMAALAVASPLVTVHEYGRSWEGRPLVQVLVASPDHHARLESILAANRELSDPETSAARSAEIARDNPAVVYFSYGVHGNESSSSEAAMWTAWDLVRGAPEVAGVLDSVVVVIDPVVNPDGRERYVEFYRSARGMAPNPDPRAREHREPWPGGRGNHYLFDLNRDWAWLSQVETVQRLATWPRWTPQIHVDFHEMSWRSSYFFFPAADPVNPLYPDHIVDWGRRIGEANAEAFDEQGWLYFTGESYDLFYPGYGDSWPSLLGAIGMTYEQAGGGFAGLAVERPDGAVLTLRDRAQHHRTTGQATLRTAALGKNDLLSGFAAFHRNVDEGLPDVLLVPGDEGEDPARFLALVDLLRAQDIRFEVAQEPFRTSGATPHPGWSARRSFPVGTLRVPARQPRGRLALTLLQPEVPLDATFSYDISAWSLPYAFGVEAHVVNGALPVELHPVEEVDLHQDVGGAGRYGALVRPGWRPMPALGRFLAEGGRAVVLPDSFSLQGARYPSGAILLPRTLNDDLDRRLSDAGLARLTDPVSSGFTALGPDLGTGRGSTVDLPGVALVGGTGTSSTSFGAHWYFLEHRLRIPFDVVSAEDLGSMDFEGWDVIVVPDGSGVRRAMGDAGYERLEAWMQGGGTLVAVGGGARALAGDLEIESRGSADEDPEGEEALDRALRTREQRDLERWEGRTPGAVLKVVLDPGHPLAFGASADGLPGQAFVLSTGEGFEPSAAFETVAHFPAGLEKVSGVVSTRTLERLGRSSWLVQSRVGSGRAILFADDPLFRMMWYSGFGFYANAVLLSHGS